MYSKKNRICICIKFCISMCIKLCIFICMSFCICICATFCICDQTQSRELPPRPRDRESMKRQQSVEVNISYSLTRSLGARLAPTSSWRPFGPLDFVLRALWAHRLLRWARLRSGPPFLTIFDHFRPFGPFSTIWTILDHFRPF